MQYATLLSIVVAAASLASAHNAAGIKTALRLVADHQKDQIPAHRSAQRQANREGKWSQGMKHASAAATAQETNRNIHKAVGGGGHSTRVRRSLYDDDLELIGRDDTHEYFARSIVDDEDLLFARDADYDDLEFYY